MTHAEQEVIHALANILEEKGNSLRYLEEDGERVWFMYKCGSELAFPTTERKRLRVQSPQELINLLRSYL